MEIRYSDDEEPGVVDITGVDEGELVSIVEALDLASQYYEQKASELRKNWHLRSTMGVERRHGARDEIEYSEEMSYFLVQAGTLQRTRMELMFGYDVAGTMGWRKPREEEGFVE